MDIAHLHQIKKNGNIEIVPNAPPNLPARASAPGAFKSINSTTNTIPTPMMSAIVTNEATIACLVVIVIPA